MIQINAYISNFDDLVQTVGRMPLEYQKELADTILWHIEEKGYICEWHTGATGLTAMKIEYL